MHPKSPPVLTSRSEQQSCHSGEALIGIERDAGFNSTKNEGNKNPRTVLAKTRCLHMHNKKPQRTARVHV